MTDWLARATDRLRGRAPDPSVRTPSGVLWLPPGLHASNLGIPLGWDKAARWDAAGRPGRAEWWQDIVYGGARQVGGVWVVEATAGIIGGPGAGKTAGWLAALLGLIPWPGPVVVCSTKIDVCQWTAPARARLGPIFVIDWRGQQAAALPWSRVRWNPLDGCRDAGVCLDRVESMVETTELGGPRGEAIWRANAVSVLAAYVHAAALEGSGVDRVLGWLRRDELEEPQRIIAAAGSRAGFGEELQAFAGKAEETRQSIMHTARPALAALADPAVVDACTPGAHDRFDIDRFLDSCGTLYFCDKGGKASVSKNAPLTVALLNAILERAEQRADATAAGPGRLAGRCDPPLLLVLDEIAGISPLPNLTQVLSQARGRGITVCWAVQSWSQLTERWGAAGAAAIWDTTAYRLIGAGLQDMDFLTAVSKSLGERQVWRPSVGSTKHGGPTGGGSSGKSESYTLMETPVLKASTLAAWPPAAAVLLGREGWRAVQLPALPALEPFRSRMEAPPPARAVTVEPAPADDPAADRDAEEPT